MSHLCFLFFLFNDPATTEIYTLSLHDALPIYHRLRVPAARELLRELEPGEARKPEVGDHEIALVRAQPHERFLCGAEGVDGVAVVGQALGEGPGRGRFVLDDQDVRHSAAPGHGWRVWSTPVFCTPYATRSGLEFFLRGRPGGPLRRSGNR